MHEQRGGKGRSGGMDLDIKYCVDFQNTPLLTRFHQAVLYVKPGQKVHLYKDAAFNQLLVELHIPGDVDEFEISYDCPSSADRFNIKFEEDKSGIELKRVTRK